MAFIGSLVTTVTARTGPFQKGMKKAGRITNKFSATMNRSAISVAKFGAALGVAVVAGAAAASVAVLKLASDFEEATQKFGVVFGSVADKSIMMRDQLVKDFGLSKIAATELLSSTGDLLTGFGMTDAAALKMSVDVQRLAADLASFSNTQGGAERVSRILTKALIGQRDGLTEIGIGILESDVKQRLLIKGQSKLIGTAKRVAIAYATMELAFEQTGKAQGDFARSSKSMANLTKTITARIQDLGAALGAKLIKPASIAAEKILNVANAAIKFIEADDKISQGKMNSFFIAAAEGAGKVADAVNLISFALNNMLATAQVATAGLARVLGNLGDLVTLGALDTDDIEAFANVVDSNAVESVERADAAWSRFENKVNSARLKPVLDEMVKAATQVEAVTKETAESMKEASAHQKAMADWSAKLNAQKLKEVELQMQLEKDQKRMLEEAQKIFSDTRTPLESIESEVKSIIEMFKSGVLDEGLREGLSRKIAELVQAKAALLEGGKLKQDQAGEDAVDRLAERLMTPIDRVLAEQQKIEDLKAAGHFEGREELFQTAMRDLLSQAEAIDAADKKKKKKIDEAGTFKELDLKNIDVKGLTGKENVEKKQLSEAEKTNKILKVIAEKSGSKVPVAV